MAEKRPIIIQPGESRLCTFDFTDLLTSTEIINSVSEFVITPSGLTVGAAAVNGVTYLNLDGNTIAVGKAAQARVTAPETAAQRRYVATCTISTSDNNVLEEDGVIIVKDL